MFISWRTQQMEWQIWNLEKKWEERRRMREKPQIKRESVTQFSFRNPFWCKYKCSWPNKSPVYVYDFHFAVASLSCRHRSVVIFAEKKSQKTGTSTVFGVRSCYGDSFKSKSLFFGWHLFDLCSSAFRTERSNKMKYRAVIWHKRKRNSGNRHGSRHLCCAQINWDVIQCGRIDWRHQNRIE